MARVGANNVNHPAAAHDFALVADPFYAGSYFHDSLPWRAEGTRETYEYRRLGAYGSRAPEPFFEGDLAGNQIQAAQTVVSTCSAGSGAPVNASGPSSVIAKVCSKWALKLPSAVT